MLKKGNIPGRSSKAAPALTTKAAADFVDVGSLTTTQRMLFLSVKRTYSLLSVKGISSGTWITGDSESDVKYFECNRGDDRFVFKLLATYNMLR